MKTWSIAHVADEVFVNSVVLAQRVIDVGIGVVKAFRGPGHDWDKCLEDGPDRLAAFEAEIEVFEAPVVGSTGSGPGVEESPLSPPGPHLREESIWWRLGNSGPW